MRATAAPRFSVFLAILSLFALCGPAAEAKLLFIAFKSPRAAKQFDEHLVSYRGRDVVIGEARSGFTLTEKSLNYTGGSEAKNVLWVGDPAKPNALPYDRKDGSKGPKGGGTISIAGDQIEQVGYVDKDMTLEGLALEYERRVDEIKLYREARDAVKKGEADWFANHGRMLAKLDALHSWLLEFAFAPAAKKVKSETDREKKVVAKEAMALREKAALASVKPAALPERLKTVIKSHYSGMKYGCYESVHVRFFYPSDLMPDATAESLVILAERVIENWRRQFVDPYRSEEFPDFVPDQICAEFFLTPNSPEAYEQAYNHFYGRRFEDARRDRMLESGGTKDTLSQLHRLAIRKLDDNLDAEGWVTHNLGHFLADMHFAGGFGTGALDFVGEGAGYFVSFEFLGRNSQTCFTWSDPTYDLKAAEEGVKTTQQGLKGAFNEVALKQGPPLDKLIITKLAQFNDFDLAKSWSVFDWASKKLGREGQFWLRRINVAATRGKNALEAERRETESLFGVDAASDVYRELDERWKKFAQREQMK